MAYGPIFKKEDFVGGKNILAMQHFQYIEGGATLDHTKFPTGHNEIGLLIARNTATGKFEPFATGEGAPEVDNHAVLNIDFKNDYGQDLIAGEVLVLGSVYEDKLPQAEQAELKEARPKIRTGSHI